MKEKKKGRDALDALQCPLLPGDENISKGKHLMRRQKNIFRENKRQKQTRRGLGCVKEK